MTSSIAVVGAGVVGLSVALTLAERGHEVQVIAADRYGLCSPVSAALWSVPHVEQSERVRQWAYRTLAVLRRDASPEAGVWQAPIRTIGMHMVEPDGWMRGFLVPHRTARRDELPADCGFGTVGSVTVIDTSRYLPWLRGRCERIGVQFEQRTLTSLDDVAAAQHVVLAAGHGSGELTGDSELRGVRTQTTRVTNPGIVRCTVIRDGELGPLFIVPRSDDVVIGGGVDDSPTVDEALSADLLRRARRAEPALADAVVLDSAIGVRPVRDRLRVERDANRPDLIHCYGHGGAGVALSWGTAEEVAQILEAP